MADKVKTIIQQQDKSSVNEAMAEVEAKAKVFTEAHKGEDSEKILAEMRGEMPVSENLEQAIETYLSTYFGGEKEKQDWPFLKKMAIHFAEWQKQLLMKDAVDGCCISNGKELGSAIDSPIGMVFFKYNKFNVGDKVKIIIIKEE